MGRIGVDCIIPVFNEKAILDVIKEIIAVRLLKYELYITIVDDGSDPPVVLPFDGGERVKIIRNELNLGNSSAVKTGLFSTKREFVVLMDGDGQHDPLYIEALLDRLQTHDLVIANRQGWKNCNYLRSLANRFYCWLSSFLLSTEVKDITSGFRALRRSSFHKVFPLFPMKFSSEVTLALLAYMSGRRVDYFPILVRLRNGSAKSKIRPLQDGHRIMQIILKIGMLANPVRFFGIQAVILCLVAVVYFIWSSLKIGRLFLPNGAVVLMVVSFLLVVLARVVDYAKMILILLIRGDPHIDANFSDIGELTVADKTNSI